MQYNDWECPLRPNLAYIPDLSCRAVPVAENITAIDPDRCCFSRTCKHAHRRMRNTQTRTRIVNEHYGNRGSS